LNAGLLSYAAWSEPMFFSAMYVLHSVPVVAWTSSLNIKNT
jgi:hypothetical protein